MPKIAVDIDDTLYSFDAVAKDALFHLAQERGDMSILQAAYTESLQWRTPADVAGLETWMEAIEIAHRPEVIEQQPPYPGAAETLQALVENGHELMYISNRDEEAQEATMGWLIANGFPMDYDGLPNLKCLHGDKIPHLRDCQYIIDDRVSTLVRFVTDYAWKQWYGSEGRPDKVRRAFGIHHPHNTNLTDLEKIYLAPSWAGLNHYMVGKGLLKEPAYEPFGHLKEKDTIHA